MSATNSRDPLVGARVPTTIGRRRIAVADRIDDHPPLVVDQREPAVMLPDGERRPLDDRDLQGVAGRAS